MYREERQESEFRWSMLGNISEGRPNLGPTIDVAAYRLMQLTLRDALIKNYGVEAADRITYEAGETAGRQFYQNFITKRRNLTEFIGELQELLKQLRIGILRVEKADTDDLSFTFTVAEDLGCSGLPVSDEEVCTYEKGFIAGLLFAHTRREFQVKEVDCWCSGDRVCRFEAHPI